LVLLALHKSVSVSGMAARIIDRDIVFALYFLEAHSSRQTAEDNGGLPPGAAYDAFA